MQTPLTLTIDGKSLQAREGQTILEVARENGIKIPTLCYMKHLTPWGGCRLCVVEIQGSSKIVPACTTPATAGTVIIANSDRLHYLRRVTLELLLSERNHICPICPYNKGDCGLQHQAYAHGIDAIRFPYLYPPLPVDLSGPYHGLDHNRCILCARCVRACEEVEGVHTLDVSHRGSHNRIVVDLGTTFGTSDTCTSCGACVASCPTGALFDKAAAFRGPLASCKVVLTTCRECPVGCGLRVFTREDRVVNVFGDFDSPVSGGHLCVRGRYETWADVRPRIEQPMIRANGKLSRVTWEEAARAIAGAMKKAKTNERALLVSPRLTNEAVQAAQKLGGKVPRVGVFVARNEAALWSATNGAGADFGKLRAADAVIILGARPSRTHGVIAAAIRVAVRRQGAKLFVFHAPKSDLDRYATVSANVVSMERHFWKRVADELQMVKRPVLVFGPDAMTAIGVTVLERLTELLEANPSGETLQLLALPSSTNSHALKAANLEPVEDVGSWLEEAPLKFLHIVASDEPDGGTRLAENRHARPLLEKIPFVVVQAAHASALTDLAQVLLPATAWSETSGTTTNAEGRELPLRAVLPPRGEAREDKTILETIYA